MIRIGVIGYGYWGPNVVRNFLGLKEAQVALVCDSNPEALKRLKETYPHLEVSQNPQDVTQSAKIDCVAIVTPVSTHFDLAKEALENGKHIFVEKPFTATTQEAEELIDLAGKKNLKIMVDHTFLFTGAVRKMKELISDGVLGDLYYYDSTRLSLGLFQQDVNVIWDLAPHDLAIMDYVITNKPTAIAVNGTDHFDRGHENIAYITVYFEDNMIAHLNVNWMAPVKIRSTLIGGSKKMLVWDDLQADEKIKVYDRGVKIANKESIYRLLVEYRSGDMWAPKIDHVEALRRETQYFVDCIVEDKNPFNDGHTGLRVVKMLEAANQSLRQEGRMISLSKNKSSEVRRLPAGRQV